MRGKGRKFSFLFNRICTNHVGLLHVFKHINMFMRHCKFYCPIICIHKMIYVYLKGHILHYKQCLHSSRNFCSKNWGIPEMDLI